MFDSIIIIRIKITCSIFIKKLFRKY